MARDTKRMALYEAIRKGQTKRPGSGRTVSFRSPKGAARRWARAQKERSYARSPESGGSDGQAVAGLRDFFSRRLDLSMSYLAAGLLLLAFLVVLAGAVRIGQMYPDRTLPFLEPESPPGPVESKAEEIRKALFVEETETVAPRGGGEGTPGRPADTVSLQPVTVPNPVIEPKVETAAPVGVVPAVTDGNNRIVIQAYFQSRDLMPVQEYFARNGVKTEILERRNYFFLVTTDKYHGFGQDSDGGGALEKIKKVGANYAAPGGYESFRPNLFQDAYGERVG